MGFGGFFVVVSYLWWASTHMVCLHVRGTVVAGCCRHPQRRQGRGRAARSFTAGAAARAGALRHSLRAWRG
jgi:hypothetical protein